MKSYSNNCEYPRERKRDVYGMEIDHSKLNGQRETNGKQRNDRSFIEMGGAISVFLQMFLGTLFVTTINVACTKSHCSFTALLANIHELKHWNVWFTWRSLLMYSSYYLLQVALSFVPWGGKKVTLPDSGSKFTANGPFVLMIIIALMAIMELFNIPIFRYIYEEYYALHIASMFVATLILICLYVTSAFKPNEKRNPYGNSGSFIYDFLVGREVNTVYFNTINTKVIAMRCTHSACILYNLSYLYIGVDWNHFPALSIWSILEMDTYKQIAEAVFANPTLVSFISLQILYLVYCLILEKYVYLTFDYHSEGNGFTVTVGYTFYPYAIMSIPRCILDHNIQLSPYMLASSVSLALLGQYIQYASNTEKNLFRLNPKDPKIAYIDSIPTPTGKHLMTSGWWGFVRHPNYLGEVIMHLCWVIPVLTRPPALFSVAMILFLMMRSMRDAVRCQRRYGTAWDTYCTKVPYTIIPGIF